MNKIVIGTVKKPHGVKGSVRVKSETDFVDERFTVGKTLTLNCKRKTEVVTLEAVGNGKDSIIIKFEGYDTYEAADSLRNCTLEIDAEKRPELEEDAFYFDELKAFEVYADDAYVGTVKDVLDMPQGAMLRIKRTKQKDLLVPFMKHFVSSVDKDKKTMTLNDIEGLL
ncbi:MAG: ribosome maturation factor RimM [Bacillota bacterium]